MRFLPLALLLRVVYIPPFEPYVELGGVYETNA